MVLQSVYFQSLINGWFSSTEFCLLTCTVCIIRVDYVTQEAAKILRLLHIRELRELQTLANEAIIAVQSLTANPKTDTKLGKVGIWVMVYCFPQILCEVVDCWYAVCCRVCCFVNIQF